MTTKILFFVSYIFVCSISFAQNFEDLLYRETGNINLFYSHVTEGDPIYLAEMVNQANDYFVRQLGDLDLQINFIV